ncbi:MAG: hypothetical protein GX235_01335 [Clostridiales bacterium]|nr:hypothetical protein [Clostridiales bacterium]
MPLSRSKRLSGIKLPDSFLIPVGLITLLGTVSYRLAQTGDNNTLYREISSDANQTIR